MTIVNWRYGAPELIKRRDPGRIQVKMMKNSDLKFFKDLLNSWQQELMRRTNNTIVDLMDSSVGASDSMDQATLESDRNFALRFRDCDRKLIKKIKKTLLSIDQGTFGICENCGEDIALERLKARPVTNHCIDCKRSLEKYERTVGL